MSVFTQFDAQYGDGYYSSIPQHDGSEDVVYNGSLLHHHEPMFQSFEDGRQVLRISDPVTGEEQVRVNGQIVETSHDNIFGGQDIYRGHVKALTTMPNVHGGVDVYDGDMQLQGMTLTNVFGGEDYLSFSGNASTVLGYQDPLMHAHEYHANPFDITK